MTIYINLVWDLFCQTEAGIVRFKQAQSHFCVVSTDFYSYENVSDYCRHKGGQKKQKHKGSQGQQQKKKSVLGLFSVSTLLSL